MALHGSVENYIASENESDSETKDQTVSQKLVDSSEGH